MIKKICTLLIFLILSVQVSLFSQSQDRLGKNHHQNLFSKPCPTTLIPDISDTYGVAFRDINEDNWPDLYLVCFRGLNRLLINYGPATPFQDATIGSGLGGNLMPQGIHNLELGANIVDVDNDGDGDIIIAGWGVTTTLFQNDGQMRFSDQTETLHLPVHFDANTSIAADVDLDGHLDLFFTDEHYTNHLLVNNGLGSFREITKEAGLIFTGISQGASFCDVDQDGDPDLYIANWEAPDLIYRNGGNRKFDRMNLDLAVCQKSINTNSVHFGDVDNDGDFDFFVANRQGRNFLYKNETVPGDSNWIFKEIWGKDFSKHQGISYGSIIADFNNDGWQDIFVTNIGPNRFYQNMGKGQFQLRYTDPPSAQGSVPGYSTGAAVADMDRDGDLDLFVANKDTFNILYTNPLIQKNWIQFKLQGVYTNRDAIGTRIEIYQKGYLANPNYLLGVREISGGQGYLSLSSPIVHFGLDTIQQIDAQFHFPSGKILKRRNMVAGQIYHLHEYGWMLRQMVYGKQKFIRLLRSRHFWALTGLILFFLTITYLFLLLGINRYQWRMRTLSIYLGLFFIIIFSIMILFRTLPKTQIVLAMDVMTLIVTGIITGLSERLLSFRKSREKYRSVLIHLSNQILHIHEDRALYNTLIDGIVQNSNFSICGILRFEEDSFREIIFRGQEIPLSQVNQFEHLESFMQKVRQKGCLDRKHTKTFEPFFKITFADFIIAIQTEDRFFGCLLLGSEKNRVQLNAEEITLYQTLANQTAVSLTINAYIAQVEKMVKTMTETKVREKYIQELESMNKNLDLKNQDLQKLFQELKQTESQLIQSEKMASLGKLVAGITHELNNPIGFIYANVKQLQTYMHKINKKIVKMEATQGVKKIQSILPEIQSTIDDTIKGSKMVQILLENLKTFSHLDQAYWKKSNVHDGIETSLMILKPELKNRIQIHKTFQSKGILDCNIGQLNQVFLNLLSNAVQAIEGQGDIWIRTFDESGKLIIEIQDNGTGIPKSIQQKIFDPFFTTKDVGKGTGLGLSISYAIIQKHGGEIVVESKKGEGTTFQIQLPYR